MIDKQIFFNEYAPWAVETMKETKVPASVTLAQAALESRWGDSLLASKYNNFFGVKGEGPGGSVNLWTTEFRGGRYEKVKAPFRIYNTPKESFTDHANVIAKGKYLRHAMEHTESAEAFIQALQGGHYKYATDPHYVDKIMNLIKEYNLARHDG